MIRIEPAMARQGFGEPVKARNERQGVGNRMTGGHKGQPLRALHFVGGREHPCTLSGQAVGGLRHALLCGVARCKNDDRKAGFDDAGRAMQYFGGAIGFSVDAAGFLEFERGLSR